MDDNSNMQINSSPAKDQAGSAAKDVLLVASAIPALVGVLGTHDMHQIIDYVGGSGFAPTLGVLVGAATVAYRQIQVRCRKRKLVQAANTPRENITIK